MRNLLIHHLFIQIDILEWSSRTGRQEQKNSYADTFTAHIKAAKHTTFSVHYSMMPCYIFVLVRLKLIHTSLIADARNLQGLQRLMDVSAQFQFDLWQMNVQYPQIGVCPAHKSSRTPTCSPSIVRPWLAEAKYLNLHKTHYRTALPAYSCIVAILPVLDEYLISFNDFVLKYPVWLFSLRQCRLMR